MIVALVIMMVCSLHAEKQDDDGMFVRGKEFGTADIIRRLGVDATDRDIALTRVTREKEVIMVVTTRKKKSVVESAVSMCLNVVSYSTHFGGSPMSIRLVVASSRIKMKRQAIIRNKSNRLVTIETCSTAAMSSLMVHAMHSVPSTATFVRAKNMPAIHCFLPTTIVSNI